MKEAIICSNKICGNWKSVGQFFKLQGGFVSMNKKHIMCDCGKSALKIYLFRDKIGDIKL